MLQFFFNFFRNIVHDIKNFVFLHRERYKLKMADEQFKLENQLCFRLYTAARLTMGAYHPYLEPLGITYPQYLVLLVLWEKAYGRSVAQRIKGTPGITG